MPVSRILAAPLTDAAPAEAGTDESAQKVTAWLLDILRFAVTRAPADRLAAIETARLIDRDSAGRTAFSFFVRSSVDVCDAIIAPEGAARFNTFLKQVDEPRLRAALRAAAGFNVEPVAARSRPRNPYDLWKGLS